MKTILALIFLFFSDEQYILINDILYKMPAREVHKIEQGHEVSHRQTFYFDEQDGCFANQIEWVEIKALTRDARQKISQFIIETPPQFLYDDEFVDISYFYPEDISRIEPVPKDIAISKFRCLGLKPIFNIVLKENKNKQDNPVGGIMLQRASD